MPTSLQGKRSARTVLLRMAADSDRAERIRALKAGRPDLTWRVIADYVGVSERAAIDWQKTGGIEYPNAKKLAELLNVEADWLWRGERPATPDPFAGSQLNRIEEKVNRLLACLLTPEQRRGFEELEALAAELAPAQESRRQHKRRA